MSRKEEMEFPDFGSHEEARDFFIKKYGEEHFQFTGKDKIADRMIYYYSLKEIQEVQIWEDGEIHVLY